MNADLFDGPLDSAEILALPDRLRWRYWAGEISKGVSGLSPVKSSEARRQCRAWLAWQRNLSPGSEARYIGIADGLRGKLCMVLATGVIVNGMKAPFVSVIIPGYTETYLVTPIELEAP